MLTLAAWKLGLMLAAGPLPSDQPDRGGEVPTPIATEPGEGARTGSRASHTKPAATRVFAQPDTSRRPTPDTLAPRLALVPDTTAVPAEDDQPTRKTVLFTVLAMTVLTISTLLLYNVRSR